jgi:hypothetical protein
VQQVHTGTLQLVQRPSLRHGQQAQHGVERARLQARLGGGERTVRPQGPIGGESSRALQEGCRRGQATAGLCLTGGAFQFGRDLLVGARGGRSEMIGTTGWVTIPVGRLGQRQMRRPAVLRRRRPVHHRTHKGMMEDHLIPDRHQPVGFDRVRGHEPDAASLRRAPQQQRVSGRVRRREQQQ